MPETCVIEVGATLTICALAAASALPCLYPTWLSITSRLSPCLTIQCPPTSASQLSAPMHPVVSLLAENVVKYHQLSAPLLFSILAAVANVQTPVQHSLLVTAVSWLLIWIPTLFRVGLRSNSGSQKRKSVWLAGAFLALSQICDRAAGDKEGIWATKVVLRLIYAYFVVTNICIGPPPALRCSILGT